MIKDDGPGTKAERAETIRLRAPTAVSVGGESPLRTRMKLCPRKATRHCVTAVLLTTHNQDPRVFRLVF